MLVKYTHEGHPHRDEYIISPHEDGARTIEVSHGSTEDLLARVLVGYLVKEGHGRLVTINPNDNQVPLVILNQGSDGTIAEGTTYRYEEIGLGRMTVVEAVRE